MAVVYSREIDGKVIHLAPSGWTYGPVRKESLFVLMDKETESLWFHMKRKGKAVLVGISGFYADRELPVIQHIPELTWSEWQKLHPDSKFVRD